MSCSFSSYKNIIYLLCYVFFLGCSSSSSTKVEETSLMSEVFWKTVSCMHRMVCVRQILIWP